MKIPDASDLLVFLFRSYRNLRHPFERELAGIETFEEWEFRKAPYAWRVFSAYASAEDLFKNKTILDIGCGGGGKSLALLQHHPKKVIGLDMDQGFIEKARNFGRQFEGEVDFICADAKKIPIEDASVDLVTMLDTFEHLDQPVRILDECKRVLKHDGKILISFPPYYHPQGAHVSDLIPLPWVHLFFSEKTLCKAYIKLTDFRADGAKRRQLKCSFDGEKWGLGYINHMTISKAEGLLRKLDFHVKYFKLIPLRKILAPLVRVGKLREYFVHTVVVVLEKGGI